MLRPLLIALLMTVDLAAARALPAPNIAALTPPRLATPAHQIRREAWHVDCGALARRGTCDTVVTLEVIGEGALEISDDARVRVTLDGAPVTIEASSVSERGVYVRRMQLEARGDGTPHVVVVTAPVAVAREQMRAFLVYPADETRHLALHEGRTEASYALELQATPPAGRAADYTLSLEVVTDLTLTWASPAPLSGDAFLPWHATGLTWQTGATPAPDADLRRLLWWQDAGEVVHIGGPMLGLGLGTSERGEWFVARLEYEIAIADFILPGLSLDLTPHGLVFAPRVEVSTPQLAVLPALFAGIGLPIRMQPSPDLGVRLLLGLQFGPVGAAVSFDLRPHTDGLDDEITAVLRFSL